MDVVSYVLAKKYVSKSLIGLGALKGAPCKIKSITPTYSAIDPTVVVSNEVTFEWESNDGAVHEEQVMISDQGNGIAKIEFDHSDTTYHHYTVTYYDGNEEEMLIPVTNGTLKRQIVPAIPDPNTADDSTFYLVPVSGKPGSYSQYIRVSTGNTAKPWDMLFIGTTD